MTERQRHTAFLKELVQSQDCEQCRELETRICQAERDERCICSAISLAIALALLSLLGLGYAAVLAPDAGADSSITTLKVFTAALLASLICLVGFIGFWYSARRVSNSIYNACRTFLRSHPRSQQPSPQLDRDVRLARAVNAVSASDPPMPSSSEAQIVLPAAEPVPLLVNNSAQTAQSIG